MKMWEKPAEANYYDDSNRKNVYLVEIIWLCLSKGVSNP